MTHLTAMWMDESNPVRANHHPQMIGSLQKLPWAALFFQPFLLRPAQSIPNISHNCFIFSVLHYQRDIIWILFLGRFDHIDVFKYSPRFPVVVSSVPHTSRFIIDNSLGDDRWDHYTIHPCNMTCVKNCAEYMVSILVFMALNCSNILSLMNASHSSGSWLQAKKCLSKTKSFRRSFHVKTFSMLVQSYINGVYFVLGTHFAR